MSQNTTIYRQTGRIEGISCMSQNTTIYRQSAMQKELVSCHRTQQYIDRLLYRRNQLHVTEYNNIQTDYCIEGISCMSQNTTIYRQTTVQKELVACHRTQQYIDRLLYRRNQLHVTEYNNIQTDCCIEGISCMSQNTTIYRQTAVQKEFTCVTRIINNCQ